MWGGEVDDEEREDMDGSLRLGGGCCMLNSGA